jgi:hypothetical protein
VRSGVVAVELQQSPNHPKTIEVLQRSRFMVPYQKDKNKQMKSFIKPYDKKFFSKVNYNPIRYSPLFPKMDSDRDGVPDYKDCEPFNPDKQDATPVEDEPQEELQNNETIYLYILNQDNKWDYQGDFIVDDATQKMIDELKRIYPDGVFTSGEYINPRRIGLESRFKKFKEKMSEYVEERDFGENLKRGVHPRKEVISAYHKQARPHIEGPSFSKDFIEREQEITWGKRDRFPWQKYNPVRMEQCFYKAPWQNQRNRMNYG